MSEENSTGEPVFTFPLFSLVGRYLPYIGLSMGIILSMPDLARSAGFLGPILALCSTIILAARTIARALN